MKYHEITLIPPWILTSIRFPPFIPLPTAMVTNEGDDCRSSQNIPVACAIGRTSLPACINPNGEVRPHF